MPTLREVQAAFAQGVLDPSLTGRMASGIVDDGIAPEGRLALYRNNVLLSLRRLLEGTFPATRCLLGPDRFAEIALAFIRSTPPDRPQLLAYGAGFPAFVERAGSTSVVHVADVARLEWAREEAYYAPDAPPLSAAELTAIPIARYAELRFDLHPSLRLVRSRGPAFSLWQAAVDGSTEGLSAALREAGHEQALVVRPEMTVTTRAIAAADLLLLDTLGEARRSLGRRRGPGMPVSTFRRRLPAPRRRQLRRLSLSPNGGPAPWPRRFPPPPRPQAGHAS